MVREGPAVPARFRPSLSLPCPALSRLLITTLPPPIPTQPLPPLPRSPKGEMGAAMRVEAGGWREKGGGRERGPEQLFPKGLLTPARLPTATTPVPFHPPSPAQPCPAHPARLGAPNLIQLAAFSAQATVNNLTRSALSPMLIHPALLSSLLTLPSPRPSSAVSASCQNGHLCCRAEKGKGRVPWATSLCRRRALWTDAPDSLPLKGFRGTEIGSLSDGTCLN